MAFFNCLGVSISENERNQGRLKKAESEESEEIILGFTLNSIK